MTTATLLKKATAKDKGVVVLSIEEYNRLRAAAVPEYYLTGKAARDLDRLVAEGRRDYAAGRTIRASSISAAMRESKRRRK